MVILPKQKKLDPNRHRSRRYMTVLPLSPGRKVELEPLDAIKVRNTRQHSQHSQHSRLCTGTKSPNSIG